MCQWKKNKYYIHEISPLFPVTLKLIKLIMKKPIKMEYCSFYCEKYIKKEKKLKENKEIIYSMDI